MVLHSHQMSKQQAPLSQIVVLPHQGIWYPECCLGTTSSDSLVLLPMESNCPPGLSLSHMGLAAIYLAMSQYSKS